MGSPAAARRRLSQALLELTGAVRIRTDVERKRLHDLPAAARDRDGIDAGLLCGPRRRARPICERCSWRESQRAAGWRVIVDAAFLKRWQRQLFRDLASESCVPFIIVDFVAEDATLRERITQRLHDPHEASDADLAVLEHQVQTQEQLTPDELDDTVVYDAQRPLAEARLPELWRGVLDRLAAAPRRRPCSESGWPAEGADPGSLRKWHSCRGRKATRNRRSRFEPVETHMSWVFLTDH